MARLAGNDNYWYLVHQEMQKYKMTQREAEIHMLHPKIFNLRQRERLNHRDVALWLQENLGLSKTAYWTRVGWIRKAGLIVP